METVGIIPAAGIGSRLSPLPFSKELFPVGFGSEVSTGRQHPKAVSQYLLEQMRYAGAGVAYFILRRGKWDIPDFYGDGSQLGMHLAYLIMGLPYGTPFSVDQAYQFVKDKQVVFGFPDILIDPKNAFVRLLECQEQTDAEVVLGVFEPEHSSKWDMVELSGAGLVNTVYPKPTPAGLKYAWAFASWRPQFTAFMHEYLQQAAAEIWQAGSSTELSMGHVLQAAIGNGLKVQSVRFDSGACLDVGTPEDLRRAIKRLT